MAVRVLVVEDNLANLELMVYLLHAFGHITVAVGDGEQALQMTDQVKPELIICDIQLPKLDGYEVVQRLKADPRTRSIPIIAVTALAMVASLTTPFRAKHADVQFTVLSRTSMEILALLENLEIDAGLTYLDNEPLGRVSMVPLYKENYRLLTAADAPLGTRDKVTWAEVAQVPL